MAVGGRTSSRLLSHMSSAGTTGHMSWGSPAVLLRGQGRGFSGTRTPARTAHQRKGADCKGDGDKGTHGEPLGAARPFPSVCRYDDGRSLDAPLMPFWTSLPPDGYTHVECYCPRCRVIQARADGLASRISMGLTIAQLSEQLRCAECGGAVQSVKPWRLEDVLGKPLRRRG